MPEQAPPSHGTTNLIHQVAFAASNLFADVERSDLADRLLRISERRAVVDACGVEAQIAGIFKTPIRHRPAWTDGLTRPGDSQRPAGKVQLRRFETRVDIAMGHQHRRTGPGDGESSLMRSINRPRSNHVLIVSSARADIIPDVVVFRRVVGLAGKQIS